MKFIQMDIKEFKQKSIFDVIVTDPPYKDCISGVLGEKLFNYKFFTDLCWNLLKENGICFIFTNFVGIIDIINNFKDKGFKFITNMIWNKEPTRTWISWSRPIRTCEYILIFTKGKFKPNFKNGIIKKQIKRSSFGGSMKNTSVNTNKKSYGTYSEILTYKNPPNKEHPTEKPIEFSKLFANICTEDINEKNKPSKLFTLDPYCGTGNLLYSFPNSIGIDLKKWNSTININLNKKYNELI